MESFDIEEFAKRLKKLREEKKKVDAKYTQGYVADLIGVGRSTYTAYENGTKQPPLENVYAISKLFNCTTDYLIGVSNDPKMSAKDYILSILSEQTISKIDGNAYDIEKILKFLEDKQISWGDKVLEGDERKRAIEVLKVFFRN